MMLLIHAALVRDVGRIQAAVGSVSPGLVARWEFDRDVLINHHTAEDNKLWPLARGRAEDDLDALAVLEAMEAEHAKIGPLIEKIDAGFAAAVDVGSGVGPGSGPGDGLGGSGSELSDHLGSLVRLMKGHFAHEERDAIPLLSRTIQLEERQEFERSQRDSFQPDQRILFFPWVTDGASQVDVDYAWGILPWFVRKMIKGKGERKYQEFTAAAFG